MDNSGVVIRADSNGEEIKGSNGREEAISGVGIRAAPNGVEIKDKGSSGEVTKEVNGVDNLSNRAGVTTTAITKADQATI